MLAEGPDEARVDAVLAREDVRKVYVFSPRGAGDGTAAIRVSLAGVPVHLGLDGRWPDGVLERLADHFLHHPQLETPIEPFAALARRIAEGRGPNLDDLGGEWLGRDWFVDREGRVSLSARWARAGRFFGTTKDDPATFERSDLWREIAGRKTRVFAALDGCAVCDHWHACGGFLRALDDDPQACAAWRDALSRIFDAWRRFEDEEATGTSGS